MTTSRGSCRTSTHSPGRTSLPSASLPQLASVSGRYSQAKWTNQRVRCTPSVQSPVYFTLLHSVFFCLSISLLINNCRIKVPLYIFLVFCGFHLHAANDHLLELRNMLFSRSMILCTKRLAVFNNWCKLGHHKLEGHCIQFNAVTRSKSSFPPEYFLS